jgi:hypothetical protein
VLALSPALYVEYNPMQEATNFGVTVYDSADVEKLGPEYFQPTWRQDLAVRWMVEHSVTQKDVDTAYDPNANHAFWMNLTQYNLQQCGVSFVVLAGGGGLTHRSSMLLEPCWVWQVHSPFEEDHVLHSVVKHYSLVDVRGLGFSGDDTRHYSNIGARVLPLRFAFHLCNSVRNRTYQLD